MMTKVNSGWHRDVPRNKLLREVTTSNDEALLYYVLRYVGAGNNWSYAFDQAKILLEEDEMNEFVPVKEIQSAIRKITSKENVKRANTNTVAEQRVTDHFAPIVGHVKESRKTETGKDWDRYLQTECLNRYLANGNDEVQTVVRTTSASKKVEDKINKGNRLAADMMN
jgi:hypothetical protein